MTSTEELTNLINKSRRLGATANITYCEIAKELDGSKIIKTVQISGLRGCGPHPMSPIAAAERLREIIGNLS